MTNWVYYGFAGIGGIVGVYYGYYTVKNIFVGYVMTKVNEELNKRMEKEEEESSFKPMHTNSAILKINHGGKSHSVYVPYNRKKSVAMMRKRVFLIKGEEKIEITQKPGIPYIICAKDLGGESIVIEDLEGNIVKDYKEDEIPSF